MRRVTAAAVAGIVGMALVGCGAQGAPSASAPRVLGVTTEGAWIRSTDGARNTTMTALFLSISNPTSTDVTLTSAACADAGRTEIHEMTTVDGKMVMQEAKGGAVIKAGSHLHLKPGGYHLMLMQLKRPLPVGDQSECTLTFDTGATVKVLAPVKVYTEEEDHYHPSDSPSPAASSKPAMPGGPASPSASTSS